MSRYRKTMSEAIREVYKVNEASDDHEISMARGELEAIADKATQLASMLQGKSDEGNPLEAWVQSKITKAKDYINSVSDYMMYNPDMKQNESHGPKIFTNDKGSIEKVGDKFHTYKGDKKSVHDNLEDAKSALNEETQRPGPANPAPTEELDLDEKFMTGYAVRYLDPKSKKRMAVAYKDKPMADVKALALKQMGAKDVSVTKHNMNFKEMVLEKTYDEKDIDKFHTGLDKLVHKHFGHSSDEKKEKEDMKKEELDEKVADSIIKDLQKAYGDLKGKKISPEMANKLSKHLDGSSYDVDTLRQLVKANIPFISTIARNKIYKKTGKFESLDEALDDYGLKGKITDNQLKNIKDTWAKKTKMDITPGVRDMIKRMDIPTKLAIQQAKINILSDLVKEDTEKEMFSQPRTLGKPGYGPAHPMNPKNKPGFLKKLKFLMKKEGDKKEVKELKFKDIRNMERQGKSAADIAKALKVSTKSVRDILGEEKRLYVEAIAALQKKADKSGMPYSILKKVYDRGMAAWKGGHRPGASQHQWAFARVNSFVTKSSGTWGGADKDLAAKVKGSK